MKTFIGFKEALELTLANVRAGDTEIISLQQLPGRVLSEDAVARVDCPSVSTSRKDGYAVRSTDLAAASEQNPVSMQIIGQLAAGDIANLKVASGQAVRITTGAPLPEGADAVLSEEFSRKQEDKIAAHNTAEAGRNIHVRGADIRRGETIAARDAKLTPALIGLLAAAGLDRAPVYKNPQVAVIATGDEVVAPGNPLPEGKLYASNMVALCAWLSVMGLHYSALLVADRKKEIEKAITRQLPEADVFLTSGGAWGSERDLILDVVEHLNWRGIYHRVRMGPGKPVGFGLLNDKPFFCLPGGPPSNEMAFLQLGLPALLKMKGDQAAPFPAASAPLTASVHGKKDWTDFIHARLEKREGQLWVQPARLKSGLQSMARKEALIIVPEARSELSAGETVDIQILSPPTLFSFPT